MIINPKRPRPLSVYTRQLLGIVDQYIDATGDHEPDLYEVAHWGMRMVCSTRHQSTLSGHGASTF